MASGGTRTHYLLKLEQSYFVEHFNNILFKCYYQITRILFTKSECKFCHLYVSILRSNSYTNAMNDIKSKLLKDIFIVFNILHAYKYRRNK